MYKQLATKMGSIKMMVEKMKKTNGRYGRILSPESAVGLVIELALVTLIIT